MRPATVYRRTGRKGTPPPNPRRALAPRHHSSRRPPHFPKRGVLPALQSALECGDPSPLSERRAARQEKIAPHGWPKWSDPSRSGRPCSRPPSGRPTPTTGQHQLRRLPDGDHRTTLRHLWSAASPRRFRKSGTAQAGEDSTARPPKWSDPSRSDRPCSRPSSGRPTPTTGQHQLRRLPDGDHRTTLRQPLRSAASPRRFRNCM
jgi:hypothetical protein